MAPRLAAQRQNLTAVETTTDGSADVVFRPAQPRRAFDEIISQVKEMIDDGRLKPGDRLPSERALAEQFAVSRNTVREALRMLEIAGLVQLRRGATGGSFISSGSSSVVADVMSNALRLTDFSLADVIEILRGLSSLTVVTACERMTEEQLARLEDNVRRAAELTRAGEWNEKLRVHLEFHTILAEATGNPILLLIMRSLLDVVYNVVLKVGITHDNSIVRSRRTVLKALRARDSDTAVRELAKYFTKLHKMWLNGGPDSDRMS
ncbi:MAG TPA: GntR family transcriptional regulator [Pseudonocardiaceae bacterium]|jgi:DNA-binding FadR family transcriptional regulator|nr:GntR family transcriptional regulator [Pseudonocardiaceae bacterium]